MKVNSHTMQTVLSGNNSRYRIPAYQRPYAWKEEHVKQLIDDIHENRCFGTGKYFIGSIICIKKDENLYEVVDGQQRLITLTLILRELADHLEGGPYNDLRNLYMREDHLQDDPTPAPVVQVREPVQSVYLKVLNGEPIRERGMKAAEKVFINNTRSIRRCLDKVLSENDRAREAKRFAKYIRDTVSVVFLEVEDTGNAYRLFNVLNNRGTPLNDADLLKSKLLELAHGNDELFGRIERAWQEMTDAEDEGDLNTFLSINQVSQKKDRDRAVRKNYPYYEYMLSHQYDKDSVAMTEALLGYARNYHELIGSGTNASASMRHLLRLNTHKEWLPAFLAFLNQCDKGIYDREQQFPQLVCLFEKVYMHRFLAARVSKIDRMSPCYYAIEAINSNQGPNFAAVMEAIKSQDVTDDFENALDSSSFYDESRPKTNNLVKCVLLRIEDARHDDSAPRDYRLKKLTVEHILPRSRKDVYWKKWFPEEKHAELLHTLGNLTILPSGTNASARASGFDQKKAVYGKANERISLEITKEVCAESEWTPATLEKRHNALKQELIDLWRVD